MPISSFFKGTKHANSLPQKRASPPSTEYPNLHSPRGKSRSDSYLLCNSGRDKLGKIPSKLQCQAAYRLFTKGSKREKQLSHGNDIPIYTSHCMKDSTSWFALCQLIPAKPEWEFKNKPKRLNQHYVVYGASVLVSHSLHNLLLMMT